MRMLLILDLSNSCPSAQTGEGQILAHSWSGSMSTVSLGSLMST